MLREEAIKELERAFDVLDNSCHMDNRRKEAFNMARVALSAEPCEDAISRQAVLDKLENLDWQELYLPIHFKRILDGLPSVTPKQKMGRWELVYRDGGVEHYLCNKCRKGRAMIDGDFYRSLMDFKYCPECGSYNGEELSALDGM